MPKLNFIKSFIVMDSARIFKSKLFCAKTFAISFFDSPQKLSRQLIKVLRRLEKDFFTSENKNFCSVSSVAKLFFGINFIMLEITFVNGWFYFLLGKNNLALILDIFLAMIFYFIFLFLLGGIKHEDLKLIPMGNKIIFMIDKFRRKKLN